MADLREERDEARALAIELAQLVYSLDPDAEPIYLPWETRQEGRHDD